VTSDLPPRELLLANLPLVRELVTFFGRRRRLDNAEIEEAESFVRLRLIEDDYAIVRQWRGDSSFRTYLTVVVQRRVHDYCDGAWGRRWRASARARRLGPLAVELEALLYRDGSSFEEACAVLASRHGVSRASLEALREKLPTRRNSPRLQTLGEREDKAPSPAPNPEEEALRRAEEEAVGEVVSASLRRLAARDRLLLRLRFRAGLSLAEIARGLGVTRKRLERRLGKILASLLDDVERAGFDRFDVGQILQHRPNLQFGFEPEDGDADEEAEDAEDRDEGVS
jgi:RNA polymerase sigma factor (sigma-70 family)